MPVCHAVEEELARQSEAHRVPGRAYLSYRVTQTYHTGVCIYFTMGIYGKGLDNPGKVFHGIEHSLPPGCDQWFNPQGGIRPVRAAADLIRSPIDLVHILQFARRTKRAMRAVSDLAQQHAELITCGESV